MYMNGKEKALKKAKNSAKTLSSQVIEAEEAMKKEKEAHFKDLESHKGKMEALKKELDDVVDECLKVVY